MATMIGKSVMDVIEEASSCVGVRMKDIEALVTFSLSICFLYLFLN